MWCPACRADVAAELSADSYHYRCARCRTELGTAVGSQGPSVMTETVPTDAERSARELLAKWHAQNLWHAPPAVNPPPEPAVVESASKATKTEQSQPAQPSTPISSQSERRPRRKHRIDPRDPRHVRREPATSAPAASAPVATVPRGFWGHVLGQMCAYFGIGLLTCGTALVIWGYFGGPPRFAPTGWLVATLGQMFLFLGVVTLVSTGMEQTSNEVATRMEVLGKRLLRIEMLQRGHELAGPHKRRQRKRDGRQVPPSAEDDSLPMSAAPS